MKVMKNSISKKIYYLYEKYGIQTSFIDNLDDKELIKGMKGVLAELELKRNRGYDKEDLVLIQKLYSRFC